MSRNKYKSSAPDGQDIQNALKPFREDLNLLVRLYWFEEEDGQLRITCEAYKEENGEKIGVARKVVYWQEGECAVLTRALQAIFYAYHDAEEKAYGGPSPRN